MKHEQKNLSHEIEIEDFAYANNIKHHIDSNGSSEKIFIRKIQY